MARCDATLAMFAEIEEDSIVTLMLSVGHPGSFCDCMERNRPNLQQRIEFPKNDIATVITLIIPLPSFSSSNGSIVVDYYY
uniref:Uncharacterized protein n=1 Tax=Ascaris lumbricoides TaxID=6252 RepID=A0A0M3HRU3_ASCLU